MKNTHKIAALWIFFICSLAGAQSIKLTVDDAVQSALKNNTDIQKNKINLEAKERISRYSWNSISPKISGSTSIRQDLPNENSTDPVISASISASIGLSSNLYSSIQKASIALQREELSYEEAKRNIELNVRKLYYELLYEKGSISINEISLETAKNQYEANQAKYSRGTLSQVDVLSAQLTYNDAKLRVEDLYTSLETNLSSFKQLIGINQDTDILFEGNFNRILNLKSINIEGIEEKNPEIQSLEKQIKEAKIKLTESRFTAWGPSLNASYSYGWNSIDGGNNWNDGGTLTLSATIPLDGILPWSASAQNIDLNNDSIKVLELSLEKARSNFDIGKKNYLKKIQRSILNIEQKKAAIDLAQKTYDMTLEAYNHGTKSLLVLQNSSDSLLSAKISLIKESYTLLTYILDLENTLGIPFGTLIDISNHGTVGSGS